MPLSLQKYRSHDYKFLVQRWRRICKESGLKMKKILVLDHFPYFEVSSPTDLWLSSAIEAARKNLI